MRFHLTPSLWVIAVLLVILVLVKFFVADVFRVDSGSMRPTIFGGFNPSGDGPQSEHVLVRFERSPELERFDLVVLQRAGPPMVKRVVGLPEESILIDGGDLIVDGRRLPAGAPRPEPIAVFDDRWLDVVDYFHFAQAPEGPWSRAVDGWRLDASGIPAGSDAGLMLFHKPMRDGYLDWDHQRVPGSIDVNDAIVECEILLEQAVGSLRLRLIEEGDTFECRIEAVEGRFVASLTRHNPATLRASASGTGVEVLARGDVGLSVGIWHRLAFSNVDNRLALEVDDRGARLEAAYERNEPYPARTDAERPRSVGRRIALGGEGIQARFRRIRCLRDHFYTPVGEHGVKQAVTLGPREYFLLGDNSADSSDSRFFGPVRAERILGRPIAVVWPPGRLRRLDGAHRGP